jgi:hypothetical protein
VATESPYRALPALLAATWLAACASPGRDRTAVYERPGGTTAPATPAAPATVTAPVPAPRVVAAPAPPPPTPAAPGAGTSDKGSRLARPTPIGQIAPEEAPPAR